MKSIKWAFVDLENIGSLEKITLENYDSIFVFVGANQSKLSLIPQASNYFTELKILKINNISKNNLDFHLSFYLGQQDAKSKKEIEFIVISNDRGFDNLIKHINESGRKCSRLKANDKDEIVTVDILKNLLSKDINKTPKSEKALKNHIKSHLKSDKSQKSIDTTFKSIIENQQIAKRIGFTD